MVIKVPSKFCMHKIVVLKGPSLSSKKVDTCFITYRLATKPVQHNTLLYWGHSKSYFKTASSFTRAQKNLHRFHGVIYVSFHFHISVFQHSPGRPAPGLSCAMDFHCNFREVTESNRTSVLPLMTPFQVTAVGIRFHHQSHWVLNIPQRIWKIYFLPTSLSTARWNHLVFHFLLFYSSPISPVVPLSLWQTSWMPGCWIPYTGEQIPSWCTPTGRVFPVKDGQCGVWRKL